MNHVPPNASLPLPTSLQHTPCRRRCTITRCCSVTIDRMIPLELILLLLALPCCHRFIFLSILFLSNEICLLFILLSVIRSCCRGRVALVVFSCGLCPRAWDTVWDNGMGQKVMGTARVTNPYHASTRDGTRPDTEFPGQWMDISSMIQDARIDAGGTLWTQKMEIGKLKGR